MDLKPFWNFSEPQYPQLTSKRTLQAIRVFLLIVNLIILAVALKRYPLSSQVYFFTHWGSNLAIASLFLSIFLAREK